jgi:hypothetical protein
MKITPISIILVSTKAEFNIILIYKLQVWTQKCAVLKASVYNFISLGRGRGAMMKI